MGSVGSRLRVAGENEPVTDPPTGPALSAGDVRAAQTLLARACGERSEVRAAERIWDRAHVARLHLGSGRSVVLKRRRDDAGQGDGFEPEVAALELLRGMPEPVAPRLLGTDTAAGILVMEDLGPGTSLADSLLTGSRERAQADLIAYAQALASMHAWSMGQGAGPQPRRAGPQAGRAGPQARPGPQWLDAIGRDKKPFLAVAASLGLAVTGVASEIDHITAMLRGTGKVGLVHGDPCPDNVWLLGGACRIFDFEHSGWGPVVLDAAYLLAPFPSCWCFANLPGEVAAPAVAAYRARLDAAGIGLGTDWEAAVTAVLGGWIVARGRVIARLLEEDHQWGTTTMRPRLLAWLRNFTDRAGGNEVLPRLRALASEMHDQLSSRWPGIRVPEYPALAQPGAAPVAVPGWWPGAGREQSQEAPGRASADGAVADP